jgi:hypothetical protein
MLIALFLVIKMNPSQMFFFTTIKIQLTRRRGVEAAGSSYWGPAACSGSPAPPAPRVPSLPLRRLVLARNDDEGGVPVTLLTRVLCSLLTAVGLSPVPAGGQYAYWLVIELLHSLP